MALPEENRRIIEKSIADIIHALGEDLNDPNFKDTPKRVADLYDDVLDGVYAKVPQATAFEEQDHHGDLVLVTSVPFYSFCAHHFLPFLGTASIAYIPGTKLLGISKLVRLFRHTTKRLTLQEVISQKAVDLIMDQIDAKGAAVHVRAEHLCMSLRGVKSQGAQTITTAYRGCFAEDGTLQQRFLQLISEGK
jgi:GTP cyclohydrolase I